MKRTALDMTPFWMHTASLPRFPKLKTDLDVDVVVVGGGITGLTAAYLLKKAGRSVAVLERNRCAQVYTGYTTAHLTCVTDTRISDLADGVGRDHAQAVWDAGLAAIEQISSIIDKENIACQFTRVPGFLHASLTGDADERESLKKDADVAQQLGFDAAYLEATPLFGKPGVRFANQAKFHPLRYLSALARLIRGDGCFIFEHTAAEEFEDQPLRIKAGGHTVTCRYVIAATHVPIMGKASSTTINLLQTKIAPYTSYVIGARVPKGVAPEASFWDTSDPYYYLRIDRHRGFDYAIFGGQDCKTGQESSTPDHFRRLESVLRQWLPQLEIDHHWMGQVVEPIDGLPYIGEVAQDQFIATGFGGNGMTYGTLAATMACDAVLGRKNPWSDLLSPERKKLSGAWDYLKENVDYPYYYLKDRLKSAEGESPSAVKPGEGKLLKIDGERVAAYRDVDGKLTMCSAYCTHMGCLVHWNDSDRTWDCPCHGSRFRATGEVMAGPAESDLDPAEVGEKQS